MVFLTTVATFTPREEPNAEDLAEWLEDKVVRWYDEIIKQISVDLQNIRSQRRSTLGEIGIATARVQSIKDNAIFHEAQLEDLKHDMDDLESSPKAKRLLTVLY